MDTGRALRTLDPVEGILPVLSGNWPAGLVKIWQYFGGLERYMNASSNIMLNPETYELQRFWGWSDVP